MPKMKTKRAVLKRFKITGTGKIKFKKSKLRHKLSNKSSDSKRKKGKAGYVHNGDKGLVLECLPYR